jgi:hypothetical protein
MARRQVPVLVRRPDRHPIGRSVCSIRLTGSESHRDRRPAQTPAPSLRRRLYWDPGEGYGAPFSAPRSPTATLTSRRTSRRSWALLTASGGNGTVGAEGGGGGEREIVTASACGGRDSAQDRIGHRRVLARPLHLHGRLPQQLDARLGRARLVPDRSAIPGTAVATPAWTRNMK